MPAQAGEDRLAVGGRCRHILQVTGREAAAHVDEGQHDALLGQRLEDEFGVGDGAVPGVGVGLLRADMEGDACRLETQRAGRDENVDRHLRYAAELARQRPFGAFAGGQDAAEHPGARRGAGDLLDLLDAIDREQRHAERVSAGDIAFLLDGVAEGDARRRRTGIHRQFDLDHRGAVEIRAQRREKTQDFRGRVRLDGIEDRRIRKGFAESVEIVLDHIEVDDQARAVRTSCGEEIEDALSGHDGSPMDPAKGTGQSMKRTHAGDRRDLPERPSANGLSRDATKTEIRHEPKFGVSLPWIGGLEPAALQARMVCLFSFPGFGDQERPERPGPSLLQGVHDFASSEIDWMGLIQVPSRQPSHSRTGGRPTSTCDLGQERCRREARPHTSAKSARRLLFRRCLSRKASGRGIAATLASLGQASGKSG